MGLKREVLCLTFLSSTYLSLATAEYSEQKIKTSPYLWLETPFALLALSLATFLNVSIINYINNQCLCSVTVHLMLYKDTFGFILVRSWLVFLVQIAGSQFNLDMLYILLMRILTRFVTGSIVFMWLLTSTLRLTTTIAVKWRSNIEPWLGVWKIRCFICGVVGFLHWLAYPSGYLTPVLNGKSPLIGFIPEIIGVSLIIGMEVANFLMRRRENASFSFMLQNEQNDVERAKPRNYLYLPSKIQVETTATALTRLLAMFGIATMTLLGLEHGGWTTDKDHPNLIDLTLGAIPAAMVILRNRSILEYIYRKNMWISSIYERLRPNQIQPRSTVESNANNLTVEA